MKAEQGIIAFAVLWALSKWGGVATPHTPVASTGQEHEPNLTPLSAPQARAIVEQTFRELMGRDASPSELAMLLAHSAAETLRWKKMYGWNWGFVTTGGGLDWFQLQGNELHFRWYAAAPLGCADWMRVLQDDFPDAWAHLDGDAVQYVDGLFHGKHGSYFGGPEVYPKYQKLVNALYNEFLNWTSQPSTRALRTAPRAVQAGQPWPLPWRVERRAKKR